VNHGARTNQNFVQIPFDTLKQKLKHKLKARGITFVPEAHTPQCSFYDEGPVEYHDEYVEQDERESQHDAKRRLVESGRERDRRLNHDEPEHRGQVGREGSPAREDRVSSVRALPSVRAMRVSAQESVV
jgi:hypothetical protein